MLADWSPRGVRTGVVISKSNGSYVGKVPGEYADAIRFLNWCITLTSVVLDAVPEEIGLQPNRSCVGPDLYQFPERMLAFLQKYERSEFTTLGVSPTHCWG